MKKQYSSGITLYEPGVAFLICLSSLSHSASKTPQTRLRPLSLLNSPPFKSPSLFWFLSPSSTLFPCFIKWGGEKWGAGGYYAGIRSQPALIPPPEMRSMPQPKSRLLTTLTHTHNPRTYCPLLMSVCDRKNNEYEEKSGRRRKLLLLLIILYLHMSNSHLNIPVKLSDNLK